MRLLTLGLLTLFLICCAASGQLSGPLSGSLGPGTFTVVGDISVASGDSLQIQPGTTLLFTANYDFNIEGYLHAAGIQTDSVIFRPETADSTWGGLNFNTQPIFWGILEYCSITGSNSSGVSCTQCRTTISHCDISGNRALYSGGGIYCVGYYNPIISDCSICDNSAGSGGGIYCYEACYAEIINCLISGNFCAGAGGGICCTEANPHISGCEISGNSADEGGGIMCGVFSNPIVENCLISGNSSPMGGGGVYTFKMSNPSFYYCTFNGNSAGNWSGGGIYTSEAIIDMRYCLVTGNSAGSGGGVCFYGSDPTVLNCTITDNSSSGDGGGIFVEAFTNFVFANTIVAGNRGNGGIYFNYSTTAEITYGDYYDNQNGNFTGEVPAGLGVITGTNANGDPCDAFYNIYLDPLFYATSGDSAYRLTENSPCIDAGDPEAPLDPDSTISDIGAFYYNQTAGVEPGREIVKPLNFSLLTAYPNPFNPSTVISFELRDASFVKLTIYDVTGREVEKLGDCFWTAGSHSVIFDGSDLSSGIYFAKLTAGDFTRVQKMILMK